MDTIHIPGMKRWQIPGMLALIFVCAMALLPAMASAGVPTTHDEGTDYYNAAVQLTTQGNYTEAIALYDKALASNTTTMNMSSALLYTYQGKSYSQIQLNDYSGALETLNTSLTIFPGDEILWNNKGFVQYNLGQYAEAVDSYNKALAIDSAYSAALVNKGDALEGLGNYQDAVTAYEAALALTPDNNETATKLADARKTASAPPVTLIGLVAVVIVIAGIAVWYVTKKSPAGGKTEGKGPKKKSGKKKSGK